MTRKPFRFGVQVSRAASAEHWVDLAREVESLGYSSLMMPDHFTDQWAPVPALAAAAQATRRLRIGTLVFANDYKHPAVLAKEAATLDVLSNGRMEFGLGAGWTRTDYDQAGLRYNAPGVRIERLAEALQVVRGLWADGPLTFHGQHYHLDGLDGLPKPAQRPHPPILIGGGGRKILTLAAQQADIVGVNVDLRAGDIKSFDRANILADATAEKVRWVREAAGDRFDSIELQVSCYVVLVGPRQDGAKKAADSMGVEPHQVDEIPHVLVGSVDDMVETLQERRERYGFSYIVVAGDSTRSFAPVVARLNGR